ncbi:Enhancer of split mgamma protein [Trichinella pseudospiralis]|uniref:Enhancer of split mgamma protein n=3 Tax=Trichinella pseudospiralis TaxID=6337 RepID=A0A0V1IQK0_TRIPS|nr:Enhancer of split mgamma protein [Trichinella pseudospiralis]KRZ25081.1 Enhancer of split mgamma protein [Trichinella pseudospiralis]KRZ35990.1 Enhancer of split mgamma protein [Trichinella pseudospiralis]
MSSSHDLVDRGNADANWSTNNQKKQKIVGTEQLSVSVIVLATPVATGRMDRKLKKPLMEKRRRARINHCLTELKSILMAADPKADQNTAGQSKVEKADILEMTVQLLKQRILVGGGEKAEGFIDGYTTCANNAALFLTNVAEPNAGPLLAAGLMTHLSRMLEERLRNQTTPTMLSPSTTATPPTPVSPASNDKDKRQFDSTTPYLWRPW